MIVGCIASAPRLGMPLYAPLAGIDGNPPIGPDGIPGIGPPSAACEAGIGPGAAGRAAASRSPSPAIGASALPQLRQNFIPAGFSPRHTPQTVVAGNPWAGSWVGAYAWASELPQFRQNDDPAGLSWPHIEQRIVSPTLNPIQVSQQPRAAGMGTGRFATQ
jgi:hypothetical protein